jgi:hypothetical protein
LCTALVAGDACGESRDGFVGDVDDSAVERVAAGGTTCPFAFGWGVDSAFDGSCRTAVALDLFSTEVCAGASTFTSEATAAAGVWVRAGSAVEDIAAAITGLAAGESLLGAGAGDAGVSTFAVFLTAAAIWCGAVAAIEERSAAVADGAARQPERQAGFGDTPGGSSAGTGLSAAAAGLRWGAVSTVDGVPAAVPCRTAVQAERGAGRGDTRIGVDEDRGATNVGSSTSAAGSRLARTALDEVSAAVIGGAALDRLI